MDEQILRIASERVRLELGDCERGLSDQLQAIEREMSARGMFRSGATVKLVADASAESLGARGKVIWRVFRETFNSAHVSGSELDADQLKQTTAPFLAIAHTSIRSLVEQRIQNYGLLVSPHSLLQQIDVAHRRALTAMYSDIDLFVLSARRAPSAASPTSVHVHGPVGSIQTGSGSSAVVTQQIAGDARESVGQALLEIGALIRSAPEVHRQDEILELVEEGRREVNRERPNLTKLGGIASAIGGSIQSIASLEPAYHALKKAIAMVGIYLP